METSVLNISGQIFVKHEFRIRKGNFGMRKDLKAIRLRIQGGCNRFRLEAVANFGKALLNS